MGPINVVHTDQASRAESRVEKDRKQISGWGMGH